MALEYKCPTCPRCGEPPKWLMSPAQAFCGNEECDAFCWNPLRTRDENIADTTLIDLSGLYTPQPGGDRE